MAKFTVKYRNKSGNIDFTEVDAANRAAVFPILKERGITPIMIAEGAMPKRKGVGGGGGSHSSFGFIVIVIMLLAALGGLAWWFFLSPAPSTRHQAPSTPTPKPITEVTPKSTDNDAKREALKHEAPVSEKSAPETETLKERFLKTPVPNSKKPRVPSEGDLPSVCDQVLAMISEESGGVDGPPLPNHAFSEKEFREAMKKEIKILPTDDRHTVALKESVIALREELLKLLDEGMTVDQVLQRYREDQDHFAEMRRSIAIELKEIQMTGTEEEAKEYRDTMNEVLKQMNCPEVKIAVTKEELDAIEEEKLIEQQEQEATEK